MSSDSTNDDVDEIFASNIPTEPNPSFEFSCADYELMVVSTEFYLLVSHLSSLP